MIDGFCYWAEPEEIVVAKGASSAVDVGCGDTANGEDALACLNLSTESTSSYVLLTLSELDAVIAALQAARTTLADDEGGVA